MARLWRRVALLAAAAVAIVALAGASVALLARVSDGPIGPFPGGPFKGTAESVPVSEWSLAAELSTIQIEVNPPSPRSLTTWVLVDAGQLFVPCGMPEHKQWPQQVGADGRVRVRVDGKIYERYAVRETDPDRVQSLREDLARKYTGKLPGENDVWFFRMGPRSPGS